MGCFFTREGSFDSVLVARRLRADAFSAALTRVSPALPGLRAAACHVLKAALRDPSYLIEYKSDDDMFVIMVAGHNGPADAQRNAEACAAAFKILIVITCGHRAELPYQRRAFETRPMARERQAVASLFKNLSGAVTTAVRPPSRTQRSTGPVAGHKRCLVRDIKVVHPAGHNGPVDAKSDLDVAHMSYGTVVKVEGAADGSIS